MNLPNASNHTNSITHFQLIVTSLAFFTVFCFGLQTTIAQKSPQTDPFDIEVPLEFTEIVKALDSNDYNQALKRLSSLRTKSKRSNDKSLQEQIVSMMKEVNRLKREFAKVHSDYESIKKKTNDPEAYKNIGNFYCAEKGDWGNGLLLLSKSNDPKIRQTVFADLKRPTTPTQQAQLADAWWKLAKQEKGKVQKAYQLRGRYWYLLARPRLSIDERVDRETQLKPISINADKIVIWNQHNGSNLDRGTVECVVTLLYKGKSVWRQVVLLPWKPEAPAGRAVYPPHVRFDQIRVDVTKFRGNGGGLGEIEVFDGTINVASNSSVIANEYYRNDGRFYPSNVIDGNKTGQSGFWLLNNGKKGWVLVDLVNFLQ